MLPIATESTNLARLRSTAGRRLPTIVNDRIYEPGTVGSAEAGVWRTAGAVWECQRVGAAMRTVRWMAAGRHECVAGKASSWLVMRQPLPVIYAP